jgi:hypothetical protein
MNNFRLGMCTRWMRVGLVLFVLLPALVGFGPLVFGVDDAVLPKSNTTGSYSEQDFPSTCDGRAVDRESLVAMYHDGLAGDGEYPVRVGPNTYQQRKQKGLWLLVTGVEGGKRVFGFALLRSRCLISAKLSTEK